MTVAKSGNIAFILGGGILIVLRIFGKLLTDVIIMLFKQAFPPRFMKVSKSQRGVTSKSFPKLVSALKIFKVAF